MSKRLTAIFIVFLVLAGPLPAMASPFCVGGAGIAPQCLYDDAVLCKKAAHPPNTSCVVNPDATLSYVGGANYCLVQSSLLAQCLFVDRNQCNGEARKSHGVCIDRRSVKDDNNPFKFDNRVQN